MRKGHRSENWTWILEFEKGHRSEVQMFAAWKSDMDLRNERRSSSYIYISLLWNDTFENTI